MASGHHRWPIARHGALNVAANRLGDTPECVQMKLKLPDDNNEYWLLVTVIVVITVCFIYGVLPRWIGR
jgi:hypothetical protein